MTGYSYDVQGGIEQSIATIKGATYSTTLDLGSSSSCELQDSLTASTGSASQVFTSTNGGSNTNEWETEMLNFTTGGTSTLISFVGSFAENYTGLDNVGVIETAAPAPGPATWAMTLLGFAGAGFMMRGLRRKQPDAIAPV